jgi:hypothetical protein
MTLLVTLLLFYVTRYTTNATVFEKYATTLSFKKDRASVESALLAPLIGDKSPLIVKNSKVT